MLGHGDYIYTYGGKRNILSDEQRQFYEDNGFVVIPKLFSSDELDVFRRRLNDIAECKVERVPTMTVMRDISQKSNKGLRNVTKLQDFQDDPILFEYCCHRKTLEYVASIIGPDFRSVHSMLIQKPPGVGSTGVHPMHQDLLYFPFRPANRIVACWTAMEHVDDRNGCLEVIPGSHKFDLLEHGYPDYVVNKAYHGISNHDLEPFTNMSRVKLHMDLGDTVLFHPLLVHGSGWNKSKHYRKAISCHFASTECHYIDISSTPSKFLADEVVEMARRKFNVDVSFSDVWRIKSRLVQGVDKTLI